MKKPVRNADLEPGRKKSNDNPGSFGEAPPNRDSDIELSNQDNWDEPDELLGRQFTMPDTKLDKAVASIDKANRRLEKLGIEDRFTYEVEEGVRHFQGRDIAIVTLTLNRPDISYNGWSFSGAHDFTPDGAVLSYKTGSHAPEVLDAHCDHCATNRRRERVYTLHSDTEGDKQVGKSCLSAFLGIHPAGLWALDADLGLDEDDSGGDGGNFSLSSQVFPADDLLAVAIAASKGGTEFISRNRATFEQKPTADVVLNDWDTLRETVTDDDRALAQKVLEWVQNVDAGDNDYLLNLRAVLAGGDDQGEKWVKRKHVPLAASAISGYQYAESQKLIQKVKADNRASFKPGYVGVVDEKIKDIPATILRSIVREGGYYAGTQAYKTIVTMITDDGHQMTWFASGSKSFAVGQKAIVTGRVSDHSQFDDADQTVIKRATLKDSETGAKLGDEAADAEDD